MEQRKKSRFSGLDLFVVYAVLLWFSWGKYKLLGLTCGLMALAVAALGFFHRRSTAAVLPFVEEQRGSNRWLQLVVCGAGLYCAWMASQAGIEGHFEPMGLWIVLSAVAWRVAVLEAIPAPKGAVLALLVLALFIVGAWFRLYRAGDIPVGMAGRDESDIWEQIWAYVGGLRLSYGPGSSAGADGVIPQYMIMAGLKLFGGSVFAFRSEGIIVGILMTGFFYVLGRQFVGVWGGLAAGFFWAVSLWPVTASRANYYMAETLFLVVACMMLLALALRKGGAWRFAAAGLFWAFCFNAYPAARVMLALVPWFYCLVWFFNRTARPALGQSAKPLLFGFSVGIAPLLFWMVTEYPSSTQAYMAAFSSPIQGGDLASVSLVGKFNEVLSRVIAEFPSSFGLLTQKPMPWCPHYFPLQYPILHPWLFSLAVLGACMALARFRNAFYSFLLYWWFIGFLPAVAGAPNTVTDRREIMILPPTLLLAAVGADTLGRLARALFGKTRAVVVILAAVAILAASNYGMASWKDYFHRNQRDAGLMNDGGASIVSMGRTLYGSMGPKGGLLISTWHSDDGGFFASQYDSYSEEKLDAVVQGLRYFWYQRNPETFTGGGFLAALTWAVQNNGALQPGQDPADVWVLLTPFNDYLEPGLKDIGAELVAEVPSPMSSDGPLAFTGMAQAGYFARLLRIKNLDRAKVALYAKRPKFEVDLSEVTPPSGSTRTQACGLNPSDSRYEPLARSYEQGQWSTGRSTHFMTDDPWFWTTAGTLPDNIGVPYSLKVRARLSIAQAGDYAFGASASVLTKIMIDHKTVFQRDPFDPKEAAPPMDGNRPGVGLTWLPDEADREGFLGPVVHLDKGDHVLEIDQAMLSRVNWNHILRPIWRPAGQTETETLPLELLSPLK